MQKRHHSLRIICFALASGCLVWLNAPAACRIQHDNEGRKQTAEEQPERIFIGCEKKDVTLSLVTANSRIAPRPQHILLTYKGKTRVLHSLSQMGGYVDVENSSQTLKLVRLRTCLALRFAWDDPEQRTEVIQKSEIATLPDYHLPGYASFLKNTLPGEVESGRLGILFQQAYQAGNFTPASVRKVKNGFIVTRWVLLRNGSGHDLWLEKIQERVGANGGCKTSVLIQRRPPRLPATA